MAPERIKLPEEFFSLKHCDIHLVPMAELAFMLFASTEPIWCRSKYKSTE